MLVDTGYCSARSIHRLGPLARSISNFVELSLLKTQPIQFLHEQCKFV